MPAHQPTQPGGLAPEVVTLLEAVIEHLTLPPAPRPATDPKEHAARLSQLDRRASQVTSALHAVIAHAGADTTTHAASVARWLREQVTP